MSYFDDLVAQYGGDTPNYGVTVPPQPVPRLGNTNSRTPDILSQVDLAGLGDWVFGNNKKKRIPTGAREFYKGRALLNTYNWLLPYTAQTVQQGANIFGGINRNEAAKSKAFELAQFQQFAPLFAKATLNADPRQARMLELFNQSLSGNLSQNQDYVNRLKGQIDQPMSSAAARDITQASLGQSALQGFGTGARDAALAYIKTGLVGEQLQQQREQTYQQALGGLGQATQGLNTGIMANKSVLGDPFLAFAGRPSQPMGSNPQSPDYGGFNNDLFSLQTNTDTANMNRQMANSAGNKAMIGQIIGGLLGMAGGAAKGLA